MTKDKVTITITVDLAGNNKFEGNAEFNLTIHEKYLDYIFVEELLDQTKDLISNAVDEYKKLNS